jgi:hypothetical protein
MESTINFVNVVASTKFAEEFDLRKIKAELENTEYKGKKFPGLVYRVKSPRPAFLIFITGKVVSTGAKNVEDVRTAIINLAKTLKSIGFEKIDYEARDPRSECCGFCRPEDLFKLERHRPGPRLREHRVRAGAVSGGSLQDQATQGSSTHIQLRQTGDHGLQISGGVRRSRADRQNAA